MPGFTVTRGLGPGATPTNLIVRGFLEVIQETLIKRGQSYKKEKIRRYDHETETYYDEYNIVVQLVAINGKELFNPIINKVKHLIKDENDIKIKASPKKLTIQSPEISINVKIVEK
jgi:hypothetical protein|tara:strand:+ start:917 stop:1264 length:348 start_codon:yes stop_codon:yes gene_type:complete